MLDILFNHVVLPARLPGKQDGRLEDIEHGLITRLLLASRTVRDLVGLDFRARWDSIRRALDTCKAVNLGGKLDKKSLLKELRDLGDDDILILHVAQQNAGLLIRRNQDSHGEVVIFEAFEASPLSEQVLASEKALQWDFPGSAVCMPYKDFEILSIQQEQATFLDQASRESIKRFAAHTDKAGSFAHECRDTIDPSMITQMLMTLLEANGRRISTPILRKRVRDEVCWADGAEKPWRRCAMWLVLRVALQRQLCTLFGGEAGRVHYKFLICLLLARLLDDSMETLTPDLLHVLKAKLCRRLVKLEVERKEASPSVHSLYEHMFGIFGPIFEKSTQAAMGRIESTWANHKRTIRRPVVPVTRYADQRDLNLTLPNSWDYLHQVLTKAPSHYARPRASAPWQLLQDFKASAAAATKHSDYFAEQYFSLSETETNIEYDYAETPNSKIECEQRCIELADKIGNYMRKSNGLYDSSPEQQSIKLLTVMELWMSMDQCAATLFGLLLDYNTGFPPDMLDVLQLSRFREMSRLHRVQQYLRTRLALCDGSRITIFSDPKKGCFAERYYDESDDSVRLEELHSQIVEVAVEEREDKEREWIEMSIKYEKLVREIAGTSCVFTLDDSSLPAVQVHNDRQCSKCFLERSSRRMRIQAFEDPLPSNIIFAKTVVFELGIPKTFAIYRDTTWKIMKALALPSQTGGLNPCLLLSDYSALRHYMRTTGFTFSLASTTKSFLATHYASVRFPATIESVILPNGLKYSYFDTHGRVWPGKQPHIPNFEHHCQLVLPKNSPYSSFHASKPSAVAAQGVTSYEVIASQGKCPSGLNVHEFMAYQALLSGKICRWPSVLIELGSSNLNFSSESVAALISHLAIQTGPALEDNPRRSMHRVFENESFCSRLLIQLRQRLESISPNFREIFCMDMLVTLILRIHSMATLSAIVAEAVKLLERAREITHSWTGLLRTEIMKSMDGASARKWSEYAFMSAILCRRTFAFYADDDKLLGPGALRCFIECSIILQDNLVGDPQSLSPFPKTALIRDLKMAHRMRFALRKSLEASTETLMSAIGTIWPEPDGISRVYSALEFLQPPNEYWIQVTVEASRELRQQTIHYHILRGILLVDGAQLGKLPQEHREAVILKQLFGNQSLLTYPSAMPGMTYMLGFKMHGHNIHLGFRNGNLIARAFLGSTVLELVPNGIFGSGPSFDLPSELVDNCVHWLDLTTGIIEVRQQPEIWKSKRKNWRIDINLRRAVRKYVTLVDPHSHLFGRVAQVFDRFEYRRQLTVFQPHRGPLQVECRRLELSFFVNAKGLLQARQLGAEIDADQDAGTWYGLNSKLVLRDVLNPRLRSIIVPMGAVTQLRNGFHVAVDIVNDGVYGRFIINDVLGRLECAVEPRLLYLKAYLHACTSSVVVDPLTKRTGTEEALHMLKSGYCQPWTTLGLGPYGILMDIAKLTPSRDYYPQGRKVMQQISWNEKLTTTIQNDEYRRIVMVIIDKSAQLSMFASQKIEMSQFEHKGDFHLEERGNIRRSIYQRLEEPLEALRSSDMVYNARDRFQSTQSRLNVYETASIIRGEGSGLSFTKDLAGILQCWVNIGGYHGLFEKTLLSDLLDVDFASEWGSLVNRCRASSCNGQDKYELMFLLGTICFRKDVDMDIVRVLLAFSLLEELKQLEPPKWLNFVQFRQNQVPHVSYLLQLIKPFGLPYPGDARSTFQLNLSAKQRHNLVAMELAHEQRVEIDSKEFAQFLLNQWPCLEPMAEGFLGNNLINTAPALEVIRGDWQQMFQNLELSKHIHQVQLILDNHHVTHRPVPPIVAAGELEIFLSPFHGGFCPTLSLHLLRKIGPLLIQRSDPQTSNRKSLVTICKPCDRILNSEIQDLENIVDSFARSESTVRQQYAKDLKKSLNAVRHLNNSPWLQEAEEWLGPVNIATQISSAKQELDKQYDRIYQSLRTTDSSAKWLQAGGLYPAITAVTLLECLRSTSGFVFGSNMKESILEYALMFTNLQRLLRIEDAHLKQHGQKLEEELMNQGHSNWDVKRYPDWLLLEVDANMLIRPNQVDVALATIEPSSGQNSVLQMNMGQGKTSCILPMAAAILADTKNLMRVIIPKPLLLQTAQLLHARLGGLLGRQIRHVPFSRRTPTVQEHTKAYLKIHKDILKCSGVMLALPEHILSFNLSGLQRLSDGRIADCRPMVNVQGWINRVARDIIDESDFTLAVRTQLIYPSGSQTSVDGHPHRWETAEALLRLVDGHLFNLQDMFPHSIEVLRRPQGGFPFVFFLRKDVEIALLSLLVNDVCSGRTSILQTKECTKSDRAAIKQFISQPRVEKDVADRINLLFIDKPAAKQNVYLLRGLLVHRILLLCLKKRWQVQYGTHPQRDPIAVPFQAKGLPSDQAEFGHIDVAIILTILAFYYQGLNLNQLRQSLEHVVKSDDPSSSYNRWTHTAVTLPDSLREWNVINVDDEAQLADIWKHVRYNIVVIDYFLNNFVFPKHAKQFRMKLQASGWDIPLFSRESLQTTNKLSKSLTTGFSGTNDNKRMLPLTITQDDLPGLLHTSASVLTTLLEPRNRKYVLAANDRGRHISELDFLAMVSRMGIQVLIDAGAMILELDNLSLAKAWLTVFTKPAAAIYFDKDNKAWVWYRNGHQVPFLASPFVDNLGECLVYIDEAHCRGTDMKLPADAQGALTLGPGITKDATVQAAMRLRQLATTQSVTFFAPPEVHQSVLDVRKKIHGDPLDSYDVICWLLEQTCEGIEQLQPLFFSQGVDFCRRTQATCDNSDFLDDTDQREAFLATLRQIERQTLEQLYDVRAQPKSVTSSRSLVPEVATFMRELNARRKGFQDTGNAVHGSALQEVEQEREVAFEVEAVREVKKPVNYSPLSFAGLHKDILGFVKTGRLAAGSAGYEQAFVALRRTALGLKYGISSDVTRSHLYVSTEFMKTIAIPRGQPNDNYQRQVNWILWSSIRETALVINPEEAERILHLLHDVRPVVTHLITYAAPVTRKMLHFNDLKYYAVPALPKDWTAPVWLKIQVGLFAGRLYFDYEEYADLCTFLGVREADGKLAESEQDDVISPEEQSAEQFGADKVDDDLINTMTEPQKIQSFTKKPLSFLHEWLAVRRKGQDFAHTPMGYVCQGKPLTANHPFFAKAETNNFLQADALGERMRKEGSAAAAANRDGDVSEDGEGFDDDYYYEDGDNSSRDTM